MVEVAQAEATVALKDESLQAAGGLHLVDCG